MHFSPLHNGCTYNESYDSSINDQQLHRSVSQITNDKVVINLKLNKCTAPISWHNKTPTSKRLLHVAIQWLTTKRFSRSFSTLWKILLVTSDIFLIIHNILKCYNIHCTCFAKNMLSSRLSWTTEPSISSSSFHLNKKIRPWTGLQ